jgi:hypothetical protein
VKNQWYCGVEGQQYGPFTWEQLRAMAAEGRIVTDSFVRRDVDQQWFQAAQVPGLLPKAHAPKKAASGDPSKSSPANRGAKANGMPASHSSGNIPVGQAVAAAPVAVAAAPAAPVFTPQIVTAAPPAAAGSADHPEPAKKGTSPLLIVAILGGACALVAVIGIGVLVWSLTRKPPTTEEQVASAMEEEMRGALEEMARDLQQNPPGELNPQALQNLEPLAGEMQKALQEGIGKLPTSATTPTSAPAAATPDAQAKVLKSIPDSGWRDVTQLRAIELNKLKLSLTSAWLASDEAGTRVDPAAGAAAKYVFVQIRVANAAPVARKYKSWNVTGGTSVVLADQANAALNLVPPSSTPAANRLASVEIAPGQNVTDTLVFAAPGERVEKLRLALAKSALADKENVKFKTGSHFALEIPLEVLLTGGSSPAAAPRDAAEPIAANQAASADAPQPLAISDAAPPPGDAAAPKPAEPKKEDRPPSKEELNRQFEELSKKEGQPEPKKGEAQK